MSKDVIWALAIAVGCLALVAVAFLAPRSKPNDSSEAPKTETSNDYVAGGTENPGLDGGGSYLDHGFLNPGSSTSGNLALNEGPGLGLGQGPGLGLGQGPGLGLGQGPGLGLGQGPGLGQGLGNQLPPVQSPPLQQQPIDVNPPANAEVKTHVIKAGELLGDISLTYYKTSRHVDKIIAANPGLDPRRLKVGSSIKIPVVEASTPKPPELAGGERSYTVRPNDGYYLIAKRELGNAARWKELETLNAIPNADLKPGMVIKLPAKAENPGNPTGTIPVTSGSGKTHTVVKGDTFEAIAKLHLGSAARWREIEKANPGLRSDNLKIGTVLNLPEGGGAGTTTPDTTTGETGDYTIKKGDTPEGIAQRELGDRRLARKIIELNPGLNPTNLVIGKKIKLPPKPGATPVVVPPPTQIPEVPRPSPPPANPFASPYGTTGPGPADGAGAPGLGAPSNPQPFGSPAGAGTAPVSN